MKSMQKTPTTTTNIDSFVTLEPAQITTTTTTLLPSSDLSHKTNNIASKISSRSSSGTTIAGCLRRRSSSLSSISSTDGLTDSRRRVTLAHHTDCCALRLWPSLAGSGSSSTAHSAGYISGGCLSASASASCLVQLLDSSELHYDYYSSLGRNNKSKSEGSNNNKFAMTLAAGAATAAAEINIAHNCQRQIIDDDAATTAGCCCGRVDDDGAQLASNTEEDGRATDCCNHRRRRRRCRCRASNQFNTYNHQAWRPCLRHKHPLACVVERRRGRKITSAKHSTINNAVDCANRWQANDDDASTTVAAAVSTSNAAYYSTSRRCLAVDHNYDTKTLFSNKDAPQANIEEGDTITTNNNNNNNISNNNKSKSDTTTSASLTTNYSDDHSGYAPSRLLPSCSSPIGSKSGEQATNLAVYLPPNNTTDPPPALQQQHRAPDDTSTIVASDITDTTLPIRANETSSTSVDHLLLSQPSHQSLTSSSSSQLNEHTKQQQTEHKAIVVASGQSQHQQQEEQSKQEQQVADCQASVVMEILQQQHTLEDRLLAPKTYPNNTLIVDLNKCHHNVTTKIWPRTTQATATTLTNNIKGCWPLLRANQTQDTQQITTSPTPEKQKTKKSKYNFQMPESLSRTNVKLKSDDYDKALSVLTSDVRYQLHLLLYRRVQIIWLLLSTIISILTPVVFTNLESLMIVGACFLWLGLQIIGGVVTAQFRQKLDQMLEKSVAQVNSYFMDHNLMLGVINVGGLLSKAKLMIPMLYFDTSQCREQIESIISIDSRKDADGPNNKLILDYSKIDLPLTKPNAMALAQSQLAKKIVLRYSQRWISYYNKRKLMFTDDQNRPRHLSTGKCLCQFIEEHFRNTSKYCEQHNQATTIINSYANTKATLVLNGKQPQGGTTNTVIRKSSQMAPTIPTLSGLVSLKDNKHQQTPEHLKIDMEGAQQPPNQQANGFTLNLLHHHQYQHHQLDAKGKIISPLSSNHVTTPVSSPDVSLEMGSDSICRSDDLVKKLRLLLELRKNELQGIDGSLFSGVLYKAPQLFPIPDINNDDDARSHTDHSGKTNNNNGLPQDENGRPTKSGKDGKKFYSQREGLFFLGTKKSQQATNRSHALEIC